MINKLCFSVAFCFLFLVSFSQKTKSVRPNIILIMADDIGFETISSYGSIDYQTPRINKMAREGMRFDQCYSQPLCTPSRIQMMTGKSNFRNYERWGYLNQNETTFAHILKSQGYATCIAGKWQLKGDEFAPYKSGFDEYLLWQLTSTSYNERYKNPKLVQNGKMTKYENGEYGPELFVNYIKSFIERKKDEPFFVYYPMTLSHNPFGPTPNSGKAYADFKVVNEGESGGSPSNNIFFKDQMAYLDKNVGEIIDKVKELGLEENTLILFTGDNGTGVEIKTQMKDGKIIPGMKGQTTEYGTHVPFIAYWPGKITKGQSNDHLVDFTDFLPTISDAATIKLPETFVTDGKSFLPHLLGKPYTPREWLFCHYAPEKKPFKTTRFVHNKEWKLYETGELFNVIKDPFEKSPVALKDLNEDQKKLISSFKEVFPKMLKTVEGVKVPKEKKKKMEEDEDEG